MANAKKGAKNNETTKKKILTEHEHPEWELQKQTEGLDEDFVKWDKEFEAAEEKQGKKNKKGNSHE